jgi:hypothetical protein
MTPVPSKDELVKIWIQRWQVKDRHALRVVEVPVKSEKLTLDVFLEI